MSVMKGSRLTLLCCVVIIFYCQHGVLAKRGKSRGKSKSGMKGDNILPLGGKWKDPDTAKYYLNPQGAKILEASHFDQEYVLGHKINFICKAEGTPRPQITWFKDGVEIYAHHNLQLHEWYLNATTLKSKMEIDPATQMDAGIYECYADNKYAVDKRMFRTDFITISD